MRLGEWRKTAPSKESMSTKVLAVLRPVLVDLGADSDAECWVAWGDDPESRYSILAPTIAGLITMAVRITGPDGPRATAKLVRWSKVAVSELSVEASGGHRIVAVQVENNVLKGTDDEADRVCEFVRGVLAGIDGRNQTAIPIALVQSAVPLGAVAGLAAVDDEAFAAPSKATAKRAEVDPAAATLKGLGATSPKAVPGSPKAGKAAAKPGDKGAEKPAGLALVPQHAAQGAPAAASTATPPVAPPPPTPIAARVVAAHHPDQSAASVHPPVEPEPEPEPDRSEWVGPHPIEGPTREPAKPRPWKP
jgi:hypothetical protein